jgi:CHAT domain-containing protein/tetratricopeptide (TPR) repeat protein
VREHKHILLLLVVAFVQLTSAGQSVSSASVWRDLARLDTNQSLSVAGKLKLLYEWKMKSEAFGLPQDSVYARLLHKIGVYEWYANKNYNLALTLTCNALRINTTGKGGASRTAAVTDLFNIAYFYDNLSALKKSLIYYDSAILLAGRGPDADNVIADSWLNKAYIYYRMGDYEKAVGESNRAMYRALDRRDSLTYLASLNQRAQALFNEGRSSAAEQDARAAARLARLLHNDFQLASACKEQGVIQSQARSFERAEASYSECIVARLRTKNFRQVSGDYNDFGAFYSDSLKSYRKAANCFLLAIEYAKKEADSPKMAFATINLGRCYFYQRDFDRAMTCCAQAFCYQKIGGDKDFTRNPTAAELAAIGNKALIQTLFDSKTRVLLGVYRQTRNAKWLTACLKTALLNDTLIRDIRHEQFGEQSKLYWRDRTRDFFSDALEACYLAHNDSLAFHFMEESRAVLLQDKLNELGANAYLPPAEAAKEERLHLNIIELEQQLNSMPDTSRRAKAELQELLAAKESLEQYIHTLERAYPVYYQYKYGNEAQPLSALQSFLSTTGQRFVEYFTMDSLCFALCVEPARTRLVRIIGRNPGIEEQLTRFVRFCSDENAQNTRFPEFLASSNQLYRLIFQPFRLPAGRVIICQDNVLVPFEALSADPDKPDFLIRDYSFSYVYSARYLLSRLEQTRGKGDFLGIAPVKFAAFGSLANLRLSEDALQNCSAPYNRSKLLLFDDANRQNFIRDVGDYTTTTILTHARSDSNDEEPVLFMSDSVIRLSDLQMLGKPASRLVVLSACQTNVGQNRNGEGILSMARGFSAAGIPAVAATQWMADESAIYSISQKFNEYISIGMNKDEALQKAKLFYMFQDKRGNLLPCYWADMVLIGNTEPVAFSRGLKMSWILAAGVFGLFLGVVCLFLVRKIWARTKPPRKIESANFET